MTLTDWLLLALLVVTASLLALQAIQTVQARRDVRTVAPSPPAPVPAPVVADPAQRFKGSSVGTFKVLEASALLEIVGAGTLLQRIATLSKVGRADFERDLLPAVHRFAEWAQLMPASEAHHHANIGGLLSHTLETLHHALVLREGFLLPRSGGAEVIAQQKDAWTYAIALAALAHDVGKPMTDLRIAMRFAAPDLTRWQPIAGSLVDCAAREYEVSFAPRGERDYAAHQRLSLVLLQKIAPTTAMGLLTRHPTVLDELLQYLGDGSKAKTSALGEIVERADRTSTAHNLSQGSRARFGTAQALPLVDHLMQAMREMLAQGALPLNRDGAAGWVFDGSVWFVAKRLADEVREHLVRQLGDDAAIPGPSKNDRLFDAWQDYGMLQVNPLTQQAVWQVVVHGTDGAGYAHKLSVLRFPLAKVWRDSASCPPPMSGRIETVPREAKATVADAKALVSAPARGQSTAAEATAPVPMPKMVGDRPAPAAATDSVAPAVATVPATAAQASDLAENAKDLNAELLDESLCASAGRREQADQRPAAAKRAGSSARADTSDQGMGRAVLHQRMPRQAAERCRAPSAHAQAFIHWLIGGLTDGSLTYNVSGAMVHFVDIGQDVVGMGLVTPAIFREYALAHGEPATSSGDGTDVPDAQRVGTGIQREFMRAGLHAPSPADGKNFWSFAVAKRGATSKPSRLSLVVLPDARRFVMEPPAANVALQMRSAPHQPRG